MEDHVTSKPGRPRMVERGRPRKAEHLRPHCGIVEVLVVAEWCGRSRGGKPWKTSWSQSREDIVRQSTEDLLVTVLGRPPGR